MAIGRARSRPAGMGSAVSALARKHGQIEVLLLRAFNGGRVARVGMAHDARARVVRQHAGMVIVADGSEAAAKRLERVLWNDPATGVMRHADAGYEIAIDCAREKGLDLPSLA